VSAQFTVRTFVAAPPEAVFDLELDVAAHTESLAFSRETVVGPHSPRLADGDRVTWRARHLGLYWTMTVRICAYNRPWSFTDEQVAGPFAAFRHVHTFYPGDGGTDMVDEISFAAPAGILGRLAERLVITRYLTRMIEARNEYLRRRAESLV
jgi:ligand-binding SRPBCC domain-containing protein